MRFDEQLTEIKRKAHESEGTLAEFLGEGANGSQLWLMTVVTSLLLSWFLWAPLGQFAKAVYNILYWEPYVISLTIIKNASFFNKVAHDAQTLYEEAFEKDHHMVKIEPNDLIFQPYTVLRAQKMLNEARNKNFFFERSFIYCERFFRSYIYFLISSNSLFSLVGYFK